MKMGKYKRLLLSVAVLTAIAANTAVAAPSVIEQISGQEIEEAATSKGEESHKGDSLLPPEGVLQEVVTEQTGSIQVHLTDGKSGTKKEGVEFQCIRVADLCAGNYELLELYQDSGISFEKIQNSNEADAAAKKLAEYSVEGTKGKTDANGDLLFADLQVGVYLLRAEDNKEFDEIAPALIAIPTWNEESGMMQYEVRLEPKHTPRPDAPGKPEAPQTGLKDHTRQYALLAIGCFAGAGVLLAAGRKRKDRRI